MSDTADIADDEIALGASASPTEQEPYETKAICYEPSSSMSDYKGKLYSGNLFFGYFFSILNHSNLYTFRSSSCLRLCWFS